MNKCNYHLYTYSIQKKLSLNTALKSLNLFNLVFNLTLPTMQRKLIIIESRAINLCF